MQQKETTIDKAIKKIQQRNNSLINDQCWATIGALQPQINFFAHMAQDPLLLALLLNTTKNKQTQDNSKPSEIVNRHAHFQPNQKSEEQENHQVEQLEEPHSDLIQNQ